MKRRSVSVLSVFLRDIHLISRLNRNGREGHLRQDSEDGSFQIMRQFFGYAEFVLHCERYLTNSLRGFLQLWPKGSL